MDQQVAMQHVVAARELYWLGGMIVGLLGLCLTLAGVWARRVVKDIETMRLTASEQGTALTAELHKLADLLNQFVTRTEVQEAVIRTLQRDILETKGLAIEAKRAAEAAHTRLDRTGAPPARVP